MKKIVIEKPGSYDRLTIQEFADPKPGRGEVLIETRACGINFADCLVRMGVYSSAKEYVGWPITPGFEVAGVVSEVGEGVESFRVGDRVVALTLFGGYTTHLVVNAAQVFPLSEHLSFEQGAAIPTVFLTAYYALFDLANIRKGNRLLVHSAAGGVGCTLVQMGKLAGCDVVGVVGATHKSDYVRQLGATAIIDKSTQNLWEEAKRLAPEGYDVILDANGTETLSQGYRHLSSGGKLVAYGFHSMFSKGKGMPNWFKVLWQYFNIPKFSPLNMITDCRSILAFNLSYLVKKKQFPQEDVVKMLKWIDEGKLRPPAIKTYPFEQVAEAHRDLESGQSIGKLVLTI